MPVIGERWCQDHRHQWGDVAVIAVVVSVVVGAWVLFLVPDLKECFRVAVWSHGFSLFGVISSLYDARCRLWWPETCFAGLSCGASSGEPTMG